MNSERVLQRSTLFPPEEGLFMGGLIPMGCSIYAGDGSSGRIPPLLNKYMLVYVYIYHSSFVREVEGVHSCCAARQRH